MRDDKGPEHLGQRKRIARTTHTSRSVTNTASTAEKPSGVIARPLALKPTAKTAKATIGQAKTFAFV